MALNTQYQTTDGGAKKQNKSTKATVAQGANSVAKIGQSVTGKSTGSTTTRKVENGVSLYGFTPKVSGISVEQSPTFSRADTQTVGTASAGGGGGSAAPVAEVTPYVAPTWQDPGTYQEKGYQEIAPYQEKQFQEVAAYQKSADFQAPEYQQSQAVTDAYNKLQALKSPTYENQYESQLDAMYNKILNRPDFSYSVNGDALYQQYKDLYTRQGENAMKDTIAQASALTGGYGNSYAQTAGQQQYQNYLQDLNNIVPSLYNQAYQRYVDEGNQMRSNYDMTRGRYDDVYSKYRDSMSDYLTDRNYLTDLYQNERNFDYSQFEGNRDFAWNQYESNRNFDRSAYESDRNYNRSAYESDRNYDRSKYESDRNYNRSAYEADRSYELNKFNSDRDYNRKVYEYDTDLDYKKWLALQK